jgi:CheY-like chemotaxis protein
MSKRVMIVDDSADARDLVCMVLRLDGYEPVEAVNGLEGLDLARRHQPCLILLDIMMPVLDGLAFRKLQLADPSIASIPVVCVSAIATEEITELLRIDCVSKPFKVEQLLRLVRHHCPKPPPSGEAEGTAVAPTG